MSSDGMDCSSISAERELFIVQLDRVLTKRLVSGETQIVPRVGGAGQEEQETGPSEMIQLSRMRRMFCHLPVRPRANVKKLRNRDNRPSNTSAVDVRQQWCGQIIIEAEPDRDRGSLSLKGLCGSPTTGEGDIWKSITDTAEMVWTGETR